MITACELPSSLPPARASAHGSNQRTIPVQDAARDAMTLTTAHRAFLQGCRRAALATVGADGVPHVVPCCFAVVDDYLYIPLDAKPKRVPVMRLQRVRDIRAHPAVCVMADRYDEDWTRLAWLQVRGVATLIEPGPEQARAIAALRARYPQYRTMPLEDAPVLRVVPERVVTWAWPADER